MTEAMPARAGDTWTVRFLDWLKPLQLAFDQVLDVPIALRLPPNDSKGRRMRHHELARTGG